MDIVHFDFEDVDGRRFVTLRELGIRKSVRAKVGPPVLLAKVFDLYGALSPRDFARLQRAAQGHDAQSVEAAVQDERPLRRLQEGARKGGPT